MTAMAASSVPAVSLEAEEERGDWLPACRAPARICSDKLRTSLVGWGGRWQREVVEPLVLRSDHITSVQYQLTGTHPASCRQLDSRHLSCSTSSSASCSSAL